MRRLVILILLPLLATTAMKGQRVMEWEEFVAYISSNEDHYEEEAWADYMEELQQLHLHPVNLNNATPRQLLAIPLLSESQVEQLIQYIDLHHGMHTLAELQLIPGISYRERQFLPLFLTVMGDSANTRRQKNLSWKDSWKHTSHQLSTRVDIPLYHRRGYLVKNGYQGSRLYNKGYYRLDNSRFSVGLRTERDAGEKGIDSYGAYLMLRDLPLSRSSRTWAPRLQTLMLGDFKLSFGQGLLLNQGFSMGKQNVTLRQTQGFRPHRSTEENRFMRGVATTLACGEWTASAFYSHRLWDATLNKATDGEAPSVKTIVRDGYHRTETERGKKGNLGVDVVGGNLSWKRKGSGDSMLRGGGLHAGITGYYQQTSLDLVPGTDFYRRIYPQGHHFGGLSTDYGYETYRWSFRGETAFAGTLLNFPSDAPTVRDSNRRRGVATLHGVSWSISPKYRISAIQRYYNHHYYSFYASAISNNSEVQNETGGLLRMDATPWDGTQLSAYVDVYYNPWPRYGMKSSSGGWDGMMEGSVAIDRLNSLSFRYNIKQKEQSKGRITDHRLRLQWQATSPSELWSINTTAMLHALKGSVGEALGTRIKYGDKKERWHMEASGLYFHTSDYDSRIYLYEPNVLEMTYIPSFYGHGIRGTGLIRYSICNKMLLFELKYGITRYFDRETQGSSLQTIYSNVKNDITLQARIRL